MAYTSISGKKLQNKLGGMLNESASAPTSSFAKRQMEKMGWKEGEGLGVRSTGIKTHIKVQKREDDVGIGHKEAQLANVVSNMWWNSSMSSTLAKLSSLTDQKSKKKKKKEKKKKKKSNANRHYTDEELFQATGGARFGMRAQRRAESKWARSEHSLELSQQEEKAKEMFEWNGLGEAKCVINGSSTIRKKRKRETSVDNGVEEQQKQKCNDTMDRNHTTIQTSTSNLEKKKKKESKKSKKSKRKGIIFEHTS